MFIPHKKGWINPRYIRQLTGSIRNDMPVHHAQLDDGSEVELSTPIGDLLGFTIIPAEPGYRLLIADGPDANMAFKIIERVPIIAWSISHATDRNPLPITIDGLQESCGLPEMAFRLNDGPITLLGDYPLSSEEELLERHKKQWLEQYSSPAPRLPLVPRY